MNPGRTSGIASRRVPLSRVVWPLAALIWTAVLLLLALQPHAKSSWWMKTLGDKVVHASAFTIGGLIWTKALGALLRLGRYLTVFAGAVAAVAVGGAIEILQFYVPTRRPEIGDFIADVLGVLPAVVYLILRERNRPRQSTQTV